MDYCSQLAQTQNAPLYGTAAHFKIGLLIEYTGQWRAKAIGNNDLPDEVNSWLDAQKAAIDGFRPFFIKREKQPVADHPFGSGTVYLAITDRAQPTLYKFTIRGVEDLLALDLAAILAGESEHKPVAETVVAVCTNGTHDRCCAKFGLPVYQAFAKEEGIEAWQVTHIGGHRYAATAIALPLGIVYGFLSPEIAPTVAQTIHARHVHLPTYRGRTFYSGHVNAADYFIRNQTGETELGAISLLAETQLDISDDAPSWLVQFLDGFMQPHEIEISRTMSDPILASCEKPGKPVPVYKEVT